MKINKSINNNDKMLIIIYEVKQIDQVLEYLDSEKISIDMCRIVAIEYGVERELLRRDIQHTTLTDYISLDADLEQQLHLTEGIARSLYKHPAMDFFVCKGIRLGEVLENLLQFYFDQFVYGFYVCDEIIKASPNISSIVVPYSHELISSQSSPLASYDSNVMVAAFQHYADSNGMDFINLGVIKIPHSNSNLFESMKKKVLETLLKIHNTAVRLFVPQKPLKIFVSDYWKHIKPFITKMDDVEIVMMDRSEAPKIGFFQIWKHRIRFYHPDDFKTENDIEEAKEIMRTFSREWDKTRKNTDFQGLFVYDGMSFWSAVEPVLKLLITSDYTYRMVSDSIYLEHLLNKNHINRVLLRATTSRQYHFLITALIAERNDIPSIELQHAIPTTEPTSAYSFFGSRYLAGYGNIVRDVYVKNHGYNPDRIVSIGSPRFDKSIDEVSEFNREDILKKLSLDPSRPILLVNVPHIVELGRSYYGGSSRLYDVIQLFKDIAAVQKDIQGLQIILKFRPQWFGPQYKVYLQEIFKENLKDVAVAEFEDPSELMKASDVITSGYSTMVIESLINQTPVILYPLRKWARAFRELFKGVVSDVNEQDDLSSVVKKILYDVSYRKDLLENMELFLKNKYSFDGRSSERIVSLLRNPPELQTIMKDTTK